MKFTIENVGPIKRAEMEFGDLTILCGKNNTGKTYITYNTFNYLDAIKYFLNIPIETKYAEMLLSNGKLDFPLKNFFDNANEYIQRSLQPWIEKETHKQMASHEDFYKKIKIDFSLEQERLDTVLLGSNFSWPQIQMTKDCFIKVEKKKDNSNLSILLQNNAESLPDEDVVIDQLQRIVKGMIQFIIPDLFIITCERTGAAAFRTTFVASREISAKQDADSRLIDEVYQKMDFRGYPRPMNKDLEFVVRFDEIIQNKSYISSEHPEIIDYFSEIVGGEYIIQEPNIVKFVPKNTNVGLTTIESSSSVRSLMELNFYLKHKAKRFQCLVIDEPELNLHPENQRKMARLLAMLVNAGIYVAITTHSDYIIKEFNTLLMLNYDDPRMPEMRKKYGYSGKELLKADSLRVYCAENGTVAPVEVSQDVGIAISSFDDNIRQMGKMQRDILYGGTKNA